MYAMVINSKGEKIELVKLKDGMPLFYDLKDDERLIFDFEDALNMNKPIWNDNYWVDSEPYIKTEQYTPNKNDLLNEIIYLKDRIEELYSLISEV